MAKIYHIAGSALELHDVVVIPVGSFTVTMLPLPFNVTPLALLPTVMTLPLPPTAMPLPPLPTVT